MAEGGKLELIESEASSLPVPPAIDIDGMRILKIDKVAKVSNDCKIKDFVWDGPCNQRETASFSTPYTDSDKCLIYKEKRTISRPLHNLAGAVRLLGALLELHRRNFCDISQNRRYPRIAYCW